MSASKKFFREWFWVLLLTGGIFLLLGYLNYTFSNKTFDAELFKNALIVIFLTAIFLFPFNELRIITYDWVYDKFGNPYENHEKFKNRFSKKTVTTIQIILVGVIVGIILMVILNG